MQLTLERKSQSDTTHKFGVGGRVLMMTPDICPDYWKYRVALTERQAVIGFPKFGCIGIGFAVEDDWNTNLPSNCSAEMIFKHIEHNKGDTAIADADCIEAIGMIQQAVREDAKAVTA